MFLHIFVPLLLRNNKVVRSLWGIKDNETIKDSEEHNQSFE